MLPEDLVYKKKRRRTNHRKLLFLARRAQNNLTFVSLGLAFAMSMDGWMDGCRNC